MAPFEALYGHRCSTPLNMIEPGERTIFEPDFVTEAEHIVHRIVQSNSIQPEGHHGSTRKLEFETGDHVYLRVSPT
jgi:hypothetical protein